MVSGHIDVLMAKERQPRPRRVPGSPYCGLLECRKGAWDEEVRQQRSERSRYRQALKFDCWDARKVAGGNSGPSRTPAGCSGGLLVLRANDTP
jgi:hypothetical protein